MVNGNTSKSTQSIQISTPFLYFMGVYLFSTPSIWWWDSNFNAKFHSLILRLIPFRQHSTENDQNQSTPTLAFFSLFRTSLDFHYHINTSEIHHRISATWPLRVTSNFTHCTFFNSQTRDVYFSRAICFRCSPYPPSLFSVNPLLLPPSFLNSSTTHHAIHSSVDRNYQHHTTHKH